MTSDFQKTGKLYPKIDIYYRESGGWSYACSTNHWRLCRDARQHWANIHLSGNTHGHKGKPQAKATRVHA